MTKKELLHIKNLLDNEQNIKVLQLIIKMCEKNIEGIELMEQMTIKIQYHEKRTNKLGE